MRRLIVFTFLLIAFISLLLTTYLVAQRYLPNNLAFAKTSMQAKASTPEKPIGLLIPTLKISLPVEETEIKNNIWPTSSTSVLHLNSSPVPGETGNAIIYGHNWSSLLGNLSKVKVGDTIMTVKASGEAKSFKINSIKTVSPNDTNVLDPTGDSEITLYTCTGFLDMQRLVVKAKYQGSVLASTN